MTGRSRRDQDGSALLIALVFVTVFSLIVAALLSFSEVGLRAAASSRKNGEQASATDGAVNAAINRFRRGGPCDDYAAPRGPDGRPLYGQDLLVRCVDDNRPASGRATRPVNALLSLGAEGITTPPGFEQRIVGNLFSNSKVETGARLIVQGQVAATGDCLGPIQTSPAPAVRCANTGGGADPAQGRDPDYTKARAVVPQRRAVPACPAGWLVALEPGSYDDAAALSALTNGACAGKVVWLKPGSYYLDLGFTGGDDTWTVNDPGVDVVAGTPRGWNPAAASRPTISVPGSCQTAAAGVQLVAGGTTHLQVTRGHVEMCADPSTSDQSIALYGLGRDRPQHDLEPTDWTAVSGFVDPGNATTIAEAPAAGAVATLAPAPAASASMTLTAFRPGVPAGSLIDSAFLRVSHRDEGDLDNASVKASVAFAGSTCAGSQALAVPLRPAAVGEDRFDLKARCGLDGPADLAGVAVTYAAALRTGGAAATATLDGIAIEVKYRTPETRKPTAVTPATTGFIGGANALEIGEQPAPLTADAALTTSPGFTSASITLAGLGDPPLPAGSTIDAAVLRVAHRDQGNLAPPTVTFPGSSCPPLVLALRAAAIVDDRVDLKACGLDTAAKLVGLQATYAVALSGGGTSATANLDGMVLELAYRPPSSARPPATVTPGPLPAAFTTPEAAKAIGEAPTPLTADAALSPTSPSARLTFGGYEQGPGVPAGSFVDSAVLRVAHQDVGSMGTPTLAVTFPGQTACATPLTSRAATLGEDRVDLKACGLTDPAQLAGLAAVFTATFTAGATTPPDATAKVDGVVLDLAYRPLATRRPATATTPAPGFVAPGSATAVDGTASAAILANGAGPASVSLTGYDQVPAGSAIDSAVLRVAHQEDDWVGPATLTTSFPGSTCPAQALLRRTGAITVDRSRDLTRCGLDTTTDLAALAATYTATAPTTTSTTQGPATTNPETVFAAPGAAKAIDGATADARLTGAATSASIVLGGYDQQPALPPAGFTIDEAKLRVAHQEDGGVAQVKVSVAFPDSTCPVAPYTPRPALGEEGAIDLKGCGLDSPAKLAALKVTYDASLAPGAADTTARLDGVVLDVTYKATSATDKLDGIELDIVYRPPAFRPLSGCLSKESYPADPGSCALVNVTPAGGDTSTRFAVQGSVYAPTAAVDVSMNGLKEQVLTRGVVARAIRLGLRAAPTYKRPVMGVPPEPVKFAAYPRVTARPGTTASTTWSNPDNAKVSDSPDGVTGTATATLDTTTPSAAITLGGFTQGALPAGAPIDAAVLRVVHREGVDVESVQVAVGGIPGSCAPFELSRHAPDLGEDQVDIAPCGLTDPAQLSKLTLTYSATIAGPPVSTADAFLDGISLDLLSGPLLRARVAFDVTRDQVEVVGWSVTR